MRRERPGGTISVLEASFGLLRPSCVIALPDKSRGALIGDGGQDELSAAGELIGPAQVCSDPTRNQMCLNVMDHGLGRLIDIKGSEVTCETGEDIAHIVGRGLPDGCDCAACGRSTDLRRPGFINWADMRPAVSYMILPTGLAP